MAVEYLGSKSRLLGFIVPEVLAASTGGLVVDLFSGTGSVARAVAAEGLQVHANDHLALCACLATAELVWQEEPLFAGLQALGHGGYLEVLQHLNALEPVEGHMLRTYSPASAEFGGPERRYLTERNAAKLDAIRGQISGWDAVLTPVERAILLRDLVAAVTRVSNTAGTYGAFLKTWKARATGELTLLPAIEGRSTTARPGNRVTSLEADEALAVGDDIDVLYLDPPYTKRQYAAYYHLLETVVLGRDDPVSGTTGLPHWRDKHSDFCHAQRAGRALEQVLERVEAQTVLLSYSSDGHLPQDELEALLGRLGRVELVTHELPRFRSSALGHRAKTVTEWLFRVECSPRPAPAPRRPALRA